MLKLYYSPGACSLAPHVVLRELELEHELERVSTGDEEHRRPEYLALNPLAKVPVLRLANGELLTENIAILSYLAGLRPDAQLLPSGELERTRCLELLSLFGTQLHPAYTFVIRPDRFVPDDSVHEALRAAGKERFGSLLRHVDRHVLKADQPWVLGDGFSIADPYLAVMYIWGRYAQVETRRLEKLSAWAGRMLQRPSFQAALRAESLVDAEGRPTPPARV